MGYSGSWLAIKGKTPQTILDELGFCTTGERQEIPEAPLSAASMPNGWFLMVSDHTEHVVSDSVLERLTADCEAVTCFVEEHVMFSSAAGWKNGLRCWSVSHDAQQGVDHLQTEGDLPASFTAIRDRLLSKQKEENTRKPRTRRPPFLRRVVSAEEIGCDYLFDIPVELAGHVTGYRYDQDVPGATREPFEVLAPLSPNTSAQQQRPSFWRRVFGG